ncbi:MAG TPA: succinate dehydrogenase, cytochrome b556 subunit [Pseudomonadales bacterium]
MKRRRPVNLDLRTIHFPLAALASITHRVSGVIVFLAIFGLLYLLDTSLSTEAGFASLATLGSFARFLLWGVLAALAFHTVAGVRHLFLDLGMGESREGGPRTALVAFVVSAVVIVLLGMWIW